MYVRKKELTKAIETGYNIREKISYIQQDRSESEQEADTPHPLSLTRSACCFLYNAADTPKEELCRKIRKKV